MVFGLPDSVFQKLLQVLQRCGDVRHACIFGSRARGDARAESDIDMLLEGRSGQIRDFSHIQAALQDAAGVYKIDVLDAHDIPEKMKANIMAERIRFYSSAD
ncbi:MAG: nucleotidyltransferase domain-containing protein [Alphaproteobacteria bacterium]|nr:nucleotidyltransferase domain-containing protein [Alphaproteobacteria bacterium]NDC55850.1 nucleotidyltransferase domain-containing protein [Alphaproteobacteria bacterium]NDG04319.1 nucleotidyltransferase domain-containing protein [Alphaproteobacteria bacterium]